MSTSLSQTQFVNLPIPIYIPPQWKRALSCPRRQSVLGDLVSQRNQLWSAGTWRSPGWSTSTSTLAPLSDPQPGLSSRRCTDRIDMGPSVTSQRSFSPPPPPDPLNAQFPPQNPNRCVHPEAPTGTRTKPSWHSLGGRREGKTEAVEHHHQKLVA